MMFLHRAMPRWLVVLAAVGITASVSRAVSAQVIDTTSKTIRRPGGPPGDIRRGDNRGNDNRREMEARFQARAETIVRDRLQLSDDQVVKLRIHTRKFDVDRRALIGEEESFRKALRLELMPGAVPNEARVTELMKRWPLLERKRIALQETEQKELATFLQPIQRARFFALQDEIRRMKQETQWGRDGGRGGPMRGDSVAFRPGIRGDSAGGKFPRPGMRPPGKVDTLSVRKPGN